MELALSDLKVIQAGSLRLGLVDQKDHAEDLVAEILLLDCLDGQCEGVAKHLLRILRFFDGLLDLVASAGLECYPDGLLEHALLEALLKLAVHDCLHFRIDSNVLFLFRGDQNTLGSVDVDALVYEGVYVFAILSDVEVLARLKSQS